MNTINKYKKHLTLSDRIRIKGLLNECKSFRKIKQKGNNLNGLFENSGFKDKVPFVCNSCQSKSCRKTIYFYRAKEIHKNYRFTLVDTRI